MRLRFTGPLAAATSLLCIASTQARLIDEWPDEKLSKFSDLVVVAKLVSTRDAPKNIAPKAPWDRDLQSIVTTLDITYVLKGEHPGKQIVVVHERLNEQGWRVLNGPILMEFSFGESYIVFLKRRQDGRYEPVREFDTGLALKRASKYSGSSAADPATLWAELGKEDAITVYRAICKLRLCPGAVRFFEQHVRPVPRVEAKHVSRLLLDLDSIKYQVRQQATNELRALGQAAEPALRRSLADPPSEEARRRVLPLLNRLAPEQWRPARVIEILEQMADPEARRLLSALAQGAPQAKLTVQAQAVLGRLAHTDLIEKDTRFAIDLFRRLPEGNLFFSPFGINAALSMTCAGARGDTAKEIARTLCLGAKGERLHSQFPALPQSEENRGYQLVMANGLFGQKDVGFLPDFVARARRDYGADLREVDFKSAPEKAQETINAWAAGKTGPRVTDMLSPGVIDSKTCLMLVNAIYFRASWTRPLEKNQSTDRFQVARGKFAVTPMLYQWAYLRHLQAENFQVLEMLYTDNGLSMLIFLPKEVDGLAAFEKNFTTSLLAKCLEGLAVAEVEVTLPKFKLISELHLKEALKSLGVRLAFAPGKADFTGMSSAGHGLWIREVVHKAFMNVDEGGTEAVTKVPQERMRFVRRALRPPRATFVANRPFLFLIRDNRSGAVLFIGRVVDPR